MKHFFFVLLILSGTFSLFAAGELAVTSGLSVRLANAAGHSVPAIDYLRRLDRVFRQVGKIEPTLSGTSLLLHLSDKVAPGTWNFRRENNAADEITLELPADYRAWRNSPALGRTVVSAMLQSRIGSAPDAPLPAHALWIADGLWAEFVQRESDGQRIFRFLWLDGMRNVVEAGGKIHYSELDLTAPQVIRPGSAAWTLYTERARLLLDIASHLGNEKSSVLKDYLAILNSTALDADTAFERTVGEAAVKRLSQVAPDYIKLLPKARREASRKALEILSERALFSIHVPLSANSVRVRLQTLNRIPYRRDDGYAATAELGDLPLLFQKYDSCKNLPRQKMQEINELGILAPKEFHLALFALSASLDRIGTIPTQQAAEAVKSNYAALMDKIQERRKIELYLQDLESPVLPPLHANRFVLAAPPETGKISKNIDAALDRAEAELLPD